jgi:polyphosphate kinase
MDQQTSLYSAVELEQPHLYLNRELSWIEFNRRVFEAAKDSRHPLLERVNFIGIFETNLDEFIMIRLAGLKDRVEAHTTMRSPDGRTAAQQLAAVRERLAPLVQEVRQYWRNELLPLLAEQHIHILDYEQLDGQQRSAIRTYFEQEIFPVLTPLAVGQGHHFPLISNLSLNLAVVLTDSSYREFFARLKVPPSLPRLLPVSIASEEPQVAAFVWIEQVIAANLDMLFPGFEIWESYVFRILRDADIELQVDEASDLIESIEQELQDRRFGTVVDLAVNPAMPPRIRRLLLNNLELMPNDLTIVDGPLGMGNVQELYELDRPELKNLPFTPRAILRKDCAIFEAIQQRDILLHHPYDSFNSIVNFIQAAARDPDVLVIKQTLYRVGTNAPVVNALLEAVENGKQVAVLVELKARFDEENNIGWARELEKAGVHVVFGHLIYGLAGLKTHAKVTLVVRREPNGLQRYVHLGTGNYNATTGRIYEDLGLFTCQADIGMDVSAFFNSLTGYSRQDSYRHLLVAPVNLRDGIIERINREIHSHEEHGNGHLIFKMNALTDPAIIHHLYRASQVGVQVDLIVRGICSLRPGVPNVSEHIQVRSIIGRFLEHSRVYYFANNGNEEMFLGSADMMQRNLNTRVEVLFPVQSRELRTTILENMLQPILKDTVNAHLLQSDGTYVRVRPTAGQKPFDSQNWFITHYLFHLRDDEAPDTTISAIPPSA